MTVKLADYKGLLEDLGPQQFVPTALDLIESGEMKLGDIGLKNLFKAHIGDPETKLRESDDSLSRLFQGDETKLQEDVNASAFSVVTKKLLSSEVIAAYDEFPKIGPELVTVLNSTKKEDNIPGLTDLDEPVALNEREEAPEASFDEKWCRLGEQRYARQLSITRQMILFDQTGMVALKAQDLGTGAARFEERQTIQQAIDYNSTSWYVGSDDGQTVTRTAQWDSGTNHLTSNAFASAGVLNTARLRLIAQTNGKGRRIYVIPKILLMPEALGDTAFEYLKSVLKSAANAINPYGPNGRDQYRNLKVLTSPVLDDISTVQWYYGDPAIQTIKKVVWPLEVVKAPQASGSDFAAEVVSRYMVTMNFAVGLRDNKYLSKNL